MKTKIIKTEGWEKGFERVFVERWGNEKVSKDNWVMMQRELKDFIRSVRQQAYEQGAKDFLRDDSTVRSTYFVARQEALKEALVAVKQIPGHDILRDTMDAKLLNAFVEGYNEAKNDAIKKIQALLEEK